MNTFDLSLDLDKRAGVTQWVTMRQGDHDGTQLRATIYDHGTQVSDSYTCRVSIRKPTDNEYYRETCSFSGGVAIVTIDEQYAASEVGITYGYFELLQGTAVIASTENFGVRILQSAIDGAIVAPPYDSAIEDALAELDEATGRISQMVIDATAEYLEAHPEITTTVQDNSLTDAKLVQKGGILQREQWLETMLPNIPRKATAEADVHSVTDSAGGGPLGIEVYGRSTQDGTPTPDAPVAIQSVEPDSDGGVKLVAVGRNLFDKTRILASTGYLDANGNFVSQVSWRVSDYMPVVAGSKVTISGTTNDGTTKNCWYRTDGSFLSSFAVGNVTVTVPSDAAFLRSSVAISRLDTMQIEVGTVATDYQPYESVTIPIDLGGRSLRSLPDGTRDEVNVDEWGHAILTQRVGHVVLDGSVAPYTVNSSGGVYQAQYTFAALGVSDSYGDNSPAMSDRFAQTLSWTAEGVLIRKTMFSLQGASIPSTTSGFATWLQSNPVTLDYKLPTPVTIDLGHLDPALLPAPDLTAYVVPSAPSVLRYGFDVAQALAELATA